MRQHTVRVYPSKEKIERKDQLAWKMAEICSDNAPIKDDVTEMIINRIIDNASVAIAAANRHPVASARAMALAHPRAGGATVFGLPNDQKFSCEWAAWANGTAVRELDYHDTFLAADYSHPADNIPPVLAVAQQMNKTGKEFLKGAVAAYELHVNLVKGICLHKHKKDHIAHLAPAAAGGIGALLGHSTETIFQAIQQAVHVSFTTRQSRKGEISSWKAYAPAHAGKLAIEAVDRCMRGEGAPSPIYEGEDSVIAYMLDGKDGKYSVPLPELGEEKRAILETYTKEHSAEYQSQALIDLAARMKDAVLAKTKNWDDVKEIMTLGYCLTAPSGRRKMRLLRSAAWRRGLRVLGRRRLRRLVAERLLDELHPLRIGRPHHFDVLLRLLLVVRRRDGEPKNRPLDDRDRVVRRLVRVLQHELRHRPALPLPQVFDG